MSQNQSQTQNNELEFTNEELEQRIRDHRFNAMTSIKPLHWNRTKNQTTRAEEIYRQTQIKLANTLQELLDYRRAKEVRNG